MLVTGRQEHLVGLREQLELLEDCPHLPYAAADGARHNVRLHQPPVVGCPSGGRLDTLAAGY